MSSYLQPPHPPPQETNPLIIHYSSICGNLTSLEDGKITSVFSKNSETLSSINLHSNGIYSLIVDEGVFSDSSSNNSSKIVVIVKIILVVPSLSRMLKRLISVLMNSILLMVIIVLTVDNRTTTNCRRTM